MRDGVIITDVPFHGQLIGRYLAFCPPVQQRMGECAVIGKGVSLFLLRVTLLDIVEIEAVRTFNETLQF